MAFLTTTFPPPQQKHELQKKKAQHDIIVFVKPNKKNNKTKLKPKLKPPSSSSWESFKNLFSCKRVDQVVVVVPAAPSSSSTKKNRKSGGVLRSCRSICSFGDVVGNATGSRRVVHLSDDHSPDRTGSLAEDPFRVPGKKGGCRNGGGGSSSSRWSLASSSSSRRMHLKRLSGCYECQAIVDPTRYPMARTTCTCSDCGEIFPKIESLEHHRAVRHAVLELGPEDCSRNIVEIIFKSSWLINNKDKPACKIQRILKVHNAHRTIQRFEDYRDAVRTRAAVSRGKKNPRCAADGNELLRFYCTTLACALGARASSSLCRSLPGCGVCTIIRHGFHANKPAGIRTTASSGGAHGSRGGDGSWAMLVCRVIAGRVGHAAAAAGDEEKEATFGADEDSASPASVAAQAGSFDSVAGCGGLYPNLEELYVFNPRAILPCFVVIYKAMES